MQFLIDFTFLFIQLARLEHGVQTAPRLVLAQPLKRATPGRDASKVSREHCLSLYQLMSINFVLRYFTDYLNQITLHSDRFKFHLELRDFFFY